MNSLDAQPTVFDDKKPFNLWTSICNEFEEQRKLYSDESSPSLNTSQIENDTTIFTPNPDTNYQSAVNDKCFNSTKHPTLFDLKIASNANAKINQTSVDNRSCDPTEYLEMYVFPSLLPAISEMLHEARQKKCFDKKRCGFSGCDFLAEYLHKKNQNIDEDEKKKRSTRQLDDIPFVKDWLAKHPRPPLPLSLRLTENEAAIIIQSFYRGYKVRSQPEVIELREWQREWREDNEDIRSKVKQFWTEAESRVASRASARSVFGGKSENITSTRPPTR